ncbi:hypothetical protein M885DRAFT_545351 [Pelagophyceae sp. CCMP2097]|nr:hypothetical protein M885DRAFT_545351 [Pelagophyceae sp. CCMP2097]
MAPWPVSHQSLAAIDKRLWVLLWLIYEVAEAYLSLFGATTSWKLVVATLGLRRLVFLAVNTLFAFVTYGGPRRMFKQFGKFASPLILVPNSTVGGWAFPDGEKGVYKLAPMEQVDLEELAAVGGGMLLKLSMHGGYAPCPPDPNAILFLEQMISFGSPTSVIGSRAAIGHVLYIAEMVDAVAAANLTKTAFEEVRDDMARPGDERGDCVNRYTTRDANRLVLREWLLGSRWNAVDAMDTPHTNAALRLCDDDKFVAGPDQRRAPPILVQMNEFDFDEDGIATAKKRAINNCARADAKLAYTPGP